MGNIRRYGALPERRHDAFLLSLLVAVSVSIAFFAIQALIPKLAYLLQLLGPEQSVQLRQVEEEAYPFVLVDPSLLDEEDNTDQVTEAESNLTRQARQLEERPELDEGFAFRDEGIDEILTAPEGNPGPAMEYQRSEGNDTEPQPPSENAPQAQDQETPGEPETQPESETEPAEPTDPVEPVEPIEPIEPPEPVEETAPEQPEAPPVETTPPPEPIELPVPPPEPAEPILTDPVTEALDPLDELPETPTQETAERPEAAAEPIPDQTPEPIDLASLPLSSEGWLDPETRRLEELARQSTDYPLPAPQQRQTHPDPREYQQAVPEPRMVDPQVQEHPRQRRDRSNRPQPTFRKIGSNAAPSSSPSASGGAPIRQNTSTSVRLIDSDSSMKLLAHRYGPYMEKLARQLQHSLNIQAGLFPMSFGRGQVKIRFGISPDGTLTYFETIYPADDALPTERLLSEQMLREAAPFDPLTPEMQRDPNFQRMTVIVSLY